MAPLHERLAAVCAAEGLNWELIFVHGGTPESWEAIEAVHHAHPAIVRLAIEPQLRPTQCDPLRHRSRQGRTYATLDDDLQHPPEEIPKLLASLKKPEIDVAYGLPLQKQHALWRNIGSRAFKMVFRYLARGLRDGSSFRLMRRYVAERLGKHREQFVFLDQIIAWYTLRIDYVRVRHDPRADGKSGYSGWKLFELAIKMIILYTDLPLRMMIVAGVVASVLSLGIGGTFIVLKVVRGSAVGFTALITAITFSASIILLSLGVLGEYIGRIYAARTERPVYVVRETKQNSPNFQNSQDA
ncbi:MAG: hypothetical protein U0176_04815 [Bacteroidia bacterium]